ncbi:MAG: GNAT family N-acetyltransferase [Roseomonas mucosa]|uniref:GNAT family N-acetyltransferase n=1 Tax=Roseomonas mucosa TaxID=207340 RepID=UPI0028CF9D76|nr:GNAT family N-acetyltransferase [Roseomonas mucosa]MDT8277903.1 GNAT family N-acetyltransferase [Roseomonas mucosa]MDU7522485.1 GNAT family N-acetyltransferase [Roseomonas mucosa]
MLGYASFGDWRAFEGHRHTVEHSVYVRVDQRGQGIGESLMHALIGRAREIGKHVMVAGIEAGNGGVDPASREARLPAGRQPKGSRYQVRWMARPRLHAAHARRP